MLSPSVGNHVTTYTAQLPDQRRPSLYLSVDMSEGDSYPTDFREITILRFLLEFALLFKIRK